MIRSKLLLLKGDKRKALEALRTPLAVAKLETLKMQQNPGRALACLELSQFKLLLPQSALEERNSMAHELPVYGKDIFTLKT